MDQDPEISSRQKKLLFIFAFLSLVALFLVMVILGQGNYCELESNCIDEGRWTAIFIVGLVSGVISVGTIVLCAGAIWFREMSVELANLANTFVLGGAIVFVIWLVLWFTGSAAVLST